MTAVATFGAGCFWGVEQMYRTQFGPALASTSVGWMGGAVEHPTYEQVEAGATGHAECVHIEYHPGAVSYADLVDFFFRMHDPTTLNRQQTEVGTQYRSVVFFHSAEQKAEATAAMARLAPAWANEGPIVTSMEPAATFYKAEPKHQQYLEHNPDGYFSHKVYKPTSSPAI